MALIFRLTCGECGEPVTTHVKKPIYDHVRARYGGATIDHDVTGVVSTLVEASA